MTSKTYGSRSRFSIGAALPTIFVQISQTCLTGISYATKQDAGLAGAIARDIDWVQAYSFMLFMLLYVPCLSTVAVIKAESKSIKFALLGVLWSLGLAWVASFIFYQGARGLGF